MMKKEASSERAQENKKILEFEAAQENKKIPEQQKLKAQGKMARIQEMRTLILPKIPILFCQDYLKDSAQR